MFHNNTSPEAKQGNTWSKARELVSNPPKTIGSQGTESQETETGMCLMHCQSPWYTHCIKHEKFWWHPLKHGDFKSKNIYSTIQTYGRYDQPQLGISPKSILALPSSNVWFHCKRQKITIKYKKWCVRGLLNIRVCLTTVYLKIS